MDNHSANNPSKRTITPTSEPRKRRQLPVSCTFCRQKKLKCDRSTPCETCLKRGLQDECVPAALVEGGFTPHSGLSGRSARPPTPTASTFCGSLRNTIQQSAGAASLQRPHSSPQTDIHTPSSHATEFLGLNSRNQDVAPAKRCRKPLYQPFHNNPIPPLNPTPPSTSPHRHTTNTTKPPTTTTTPSINKTLSSLLTLLSPVPPSITTTTPLKTHDIFLHLPSLPLALRLLDHYTDKVSWNFALIHPPTVKASLLDMYRAAETTEADSDAELVDAAAAALVCVVLGLSAHFHSPCLNMSDPDAQALASKLLNTASMCIEASGLVTTPTLDSLQAVLLLVYYLLPNAGLEVDIPGVFATLAGLAAKLHVHQMDLPTHLAHRAKSPHEIDHVDLELKRRIWWGIASSEWLYSDSTGLLRYTVHPLHFHVNPPSNTSNASLSPSGCYARPLSVPTELTYFILRARVANITREIIDVCAEAGCESPGDLEYGRVLELDGKLQSQWGVGSMPSFFSLEEGEYSANTAVRREHPYLAYQIFVAHIGFQARLSQLHRPFLVRAKRAQQEQQNRRFDYSRTVSLGAARTAIALAKRMQEAVLDCSPRLLQMSAATKNLFLAILTLVMEWRGGLVGDGSEDGEFIGGADGGGESNELKQEIQEACQVLKKASESAIAQRGVQQLMEILDEWKSATKVRDGTVMKSSATKIGDHEAVKPLTSDSVPVDISDQAKGDKGPDAATVSSPDPTLFDPSFFPWLDFDASSDPLDWERLFLQLETS